MDQHPTHDKVALLRLAFKGLDDNELQEIAELTEFGTYPPDQVLCHEGEYEDVLYVVADGSLVISKKMLDDEGERVLRVAGRGDLVGEMGLIQNAPRAATVRTLTECTMLEMDKKDFETILGRSPRMAIDIIGITLDRMRANDHMAITELQRTNNVLRLLDRNKLDFIQVAAHELRTPLTVLSGYVELLRAFPEIQENASLAEVLDGLSKGSERMQEVVNLMLDVTRVDAEIVKVASAPFPVKQIISDVVHGLTKASRNRDVEITVDHDVKTSDIHGDPTLIQKALYHLIVNAIKYTPDGGKIHISTHPALIDEDLPGVEITVRDSGIGLDAEHHELVFEKFYQVGAVAIHSSGRTTFKGGGPGLGLAIVRGVAKAHGGRVWVESPGQDEKALPGSTFHLQLPIDPPRAAR